MSDFGWLAKVDTAEWNAQFASKECLRLTLADFARRSACAHAPSVIGEFRTWAFAHPSQHYSVVWTNASDPDDLLLIFRKS